MRNFILLVSVLFLSFTCLHAQERLTGLGQNVRLIKESKKVYSAKSETYPAVQLPFIEDFSNYTIYPNPALFIDKQAFVNNSYPVLPPTVGVATLDALNEHGKIYSHANKTGFGADTLTSRPIRLDSLFNPKRAILLQDSLYFSFYYQPSGGAGDPTQAIGDPPESGDSLVLEFGYETGDTVFLGYQYSEFVADQDYAAGEVIPNPFMPDMNYIFTTDVLEGDTIYMPSDSIIGPEKIWNRVWATPGFSLGDLIARTGKYFEQIMIPIRNSAYLKNTFQFRFRNYASLQSNNQPRWASNVDQWHIDYIRLDVNRTAQDLYPNDLAFVGPAVSMLKKYQAMPWNQYTASDLKDTLHNQLSNLSNSIQNSNYTYNVYKNETQLIKDHPTNNENIRPFYPYGLQVYQPHSDPLVDFSLPTDAADSALFTITHIFKMVGSGDVRLENDTTIFNQKFYNYYAYDDGSAENGYALNPEQGFPSAELAMRFTLNRPDTLRCIRMWFNDVYDRDTPVEFTLMVWADNNNKPGTILYSKEHQVPMFADEFLDFVNYYIDEPFVVSGTFYVGFLQTGSTQLNIGFDRNVDPAQKNIVNGEHFMCKTARDWSASLFQGTPMIRPVLGKYYNDVSIKEPEPEPVNFVIYPNPASGEIHVRLINEQGIESEDLEFSIYSISGNLLFTTTSKTINTSSLADGFYLLRLLNKKTKQTSYSKFIIQK